MKPIKNYSIWLSFIGMIFVSTLASCFGDNGGGKGRNPNEPDPETQEKDLVVTLGKIYEADFTVAPGLPCNITAINNEVSPETDGSYKLDTNKRYVLEIISKRDNKELQLSQEGNLNVSATKDPFSNFQPGLYSEDDGSLYSKYKNNKNYLGFTLADSTNTTGSTGKIIIEVTDSKAGNKKTNLSVSIEVK